MKTISQPITAERFFSPEFQGLSLEEKRKILGEESFNLMGKRLKNKELKKREIELQKEKDKKEKESFVISRNKLIKKAREEGVTLEKIGNSLGITRERVRQLEYIMGLPSRQKSRAKIRKQMKCSNPKCSKIMLLHMSATRKYCSLKCRRAMIIKKTITEKRAEWNRRTRLYYHTVLKNKPEFKAKTKIRNDRYWAKIKKMKKYYAKRNRK